MSRTLKIVLIALVGLFLLGGALMTGFVLGRVSARWGGQERIFGYGPGMMNPGWNEDGGPRFHNGPDMMDPRWNEEGGPGFHMGPGWNGNSGPGVRPNSEDVDPISMEEARTAVQNFLLAMNRDDLEAGDILIFSGGAYARVMETDTGMGALEVMVDPVSREALPIHGPALMLNQRYGVNDQDGDASPEENLSAEEARQAAEDYLKQQGSEGTASEPVPFYGYYSVEVQQDEQVLGLLVVSAADGSVFAYDDWGEFIERSQ